MAETKENEIITKVIYDPQAGYVDPTPVSDPSTEFEDFIIGAGNPPVKITEIKSTPVEEIAWLHNDPTSVRIDSESTADVLSNDTFSQITVTVDDLSTGGYTEFNLR